MSSGSNQPQPSFQPTEAQNESTLPGETPGGGPSLDELVRETIDAQCEEVSLSPEVWTAFTQVARRNPSAASVDLPILKELVQAVLAFRFERLQAESGALSLCAERVAESLWEDTPSRERLDRLWKTLHGVSP